MQETTRSYNRITDASSRIWFAQASSMRGVALFLDFSGTLSEYNRSRTREEAKYDALPSDWLVLGNDIGKLLRRAEPSDRRGQLL